MSDRRTIALLSLVRQGLSLGLDFGAHSLETMLGVAETVEESVLEADSFVRAPGRLAFALANPPLRTGAFSAIRVLVAGSVLPPERVRLRTGAGSPWWSSDEISPDRPWRRGPGDRTEFEVEATTEPGRPVSVRLEFDCIPIPPLVWLEFVATPRERAP